MGALAPKGNIRWRPELQILTKERQAEGIRAAKDRGVYQGRPRKLMAAQLAEARELIATGVPKAQIARHLGVNRSTLHRALLAVQTTSVTRAVDFEN